MDLNRLTIIKTYFMANWCNNTVDFIGSAETFATMAEMFTAMALKETETQQGQLPSFYKKEGGWMHCIGFEDGLLYYDTKTCPNTDVVLAIAQHFGVGFTYRYEEMGWQFYGEVTYEDGVMTKVSLEDADFELYEMVEEETWKFEGKEYGSEYDILDILLDRKRANATLIIDAKIIDDEKEA